MKPVFVDDEKQVWTIDNPDAVKDFYGDHVTVTATEDASAKSVHIDIDRQRKVGPLRRSEARRDSPRRAISGSVVSVPLAGPVSSRASGEGWIERNRPENPWHEQFGTEKSLPKAIGPKKWTGMSISLSPA